jgi:hypothetical protein
MKYLGLILLCSLTPILATAARDNAWGSETLYTDYSAQALLGAVELRDLKFNISDSSTPVYADFSPLPLLGGAWGTPPRGDRFQYGLEASFLIGTQVDKLNYLYAGGGGLRISLSTSLWLFDLAGGAYANLYLDPGKKVRIYAAAGPQLMYATYRENRDFSDGSDSTSSSNNAFGAGAYARAGIEFRIHNSGMAGLGVRNTWSSMNFSNAGGSSHLNGTAVFATYTLGF